MRGCKPKPTVLKVLDGNPGKRPLNGREPEAPQGTPDCPAWLDEEAVAEWERMVPVLREMGLLSRADRTALAAYCVVYSRWKNAEEQVRKFGPIVKSPDKGVPMKSPYLCIADRSLEMLCKFMVEFGLTPSSRTRIRVPGGREEADEFDRFLEVG